MNPDFLSLLVLLCSFFQGGDSLVFTPSDSLVLARSSFSASYFYLSFIMFGEAAPVTDWRPVCGVPLGQVPAQLLPRSGYEYAWTGVCWSCFSSLACPCCYYYVACVWHCHDVTWLGATFSVLCEDFHDTAWHICLSPYICILSYCPVPVPPASTENSMPFMK